MDLNWDKLREKIDAEHTDDLFTLSEQLDVPEEDIIMQALKMGLHDIITLCDWFEHE